MTGIAVQDAIERADAAAWEKENENADWDRKLEAVGNINVALEHFNKGTDILALAVKKVEGIPAEDRVASILNEFENLVCDLKGLKERFVRGE